MRALSVTALSAALLLGCSAGLFQRNLDAAMGQPVDVVLARFGMPDADTTIAGRRVLIWANQNTNIVPFYSPTYTSGYVGRVPFSATTGGIGYMPVNSNCQIRVFIDNSSRVVSWDLNGNESGCSRYASALSRQPIAAPAAGPVAPASGPAHTPSASAARASGGSGGSGTPGSKPPPL